MKNKRIVLVERRPPPGQRAHKSSVKTHLGEREEKGKRFLTAGVMVSRIEIQRENFCHIFVNNLKIRPVRLTKIYSTLTEYMWIMCENLKEIHE